MCIAKNVELFSHFPLPPPLTSSHYTPAQLRILIISSNWRVSVQSLQMTCVKWISQTNRCVVATALCMSVLVSYLVTPRISSTSNYQHHPHPPFTYSMPLLHSCWQANLTRGNGPVLVGSASGAAAMTSPETAFQVQSANTGCQNQHNNSVYLVFMLVLSRAAPSIHPHHPQSSRKIVFPTQLPVDHLKPVAVTCMPCLPQLCWQNSLTRPVTSRVHWHPRDRARTDPKCCCDFN